MSQGFIASLAKAPRQCELREALGRHIRAGLRRARSGNVPEFEEGKETARELGATEPTEQPRLGASVWHKGPHIQAPGGFEPLPASASSALTVNCNWRAGL